MFARGKQLYGLCSPDPATRRSLPRTCTRVHSPRGTSALSRPDLQASRLAPASPRTPFRHQINQPPGNPKHAGLTREGRGAERGHNGEPTRETALRTGSLGPRRRLGCHDLTAAPTVVGTRPVAYGSLVVGAIAIGYGSLWTAATDALTRIDPRTDEVLAIGAHPAGNEPSDRRQQRLGAHTAQITLAEALLPDQAHRGTVGSGPRD
jgi:hypothetical protein